MISLYNDDCLTSMKDIMTKSVDLVLVDLPYGQTDCEWDIKINLEEMWSVLKQICKDECVYVFFTTTKFGYDLIHSNPKWFRYDLVWEKHCSVGFLNCNKMPLRIHEMIYIFSNPSVKNKVYNPQKTPGKPYCTKSNEIKSGVYGVKPNNGINNTGDRFPTSVLKYHQTDKKIHPTQKPIELCDWLINTYSNENDLVLDFCMGSGTTGISCLKNKRQFIGIEKDENIYDTAENRINTCIDKMEENGI